MNDVYKGQLLTTFLLDGKSQLAVEHALENRMETEELMRMATALLEKGRRIESCRRDGTKAIRLLTGLWDLVKQLDDSGAILRGRPRHYLEED